MRYAVPDRLHEILTRPRWSSQLTRTLTALLDQADTMAWEEMLAAVDRESDRVEALLTAASSPLGMASARDVQALVLEALWHHATACSLLRSALLGEGEVAVDDVRHHLERGDELMANAQEQLETLRFPLAPVA
jgi:hypothetical protein